MQYLKSATSLNQTKIVGLISHLNELRPGHGGAQFSVCLEALKLFQRLQLPTKYPDEWPFFVNTADATTAHCYVSMVGKKFTVESFWMAYKKFAGMFMSETIVADLLLVKARKGDWLEVQDNLAQVTKFQTGKLMFGFAVFSNATLQISSFMNTFIEDRLKVAHVTRTLVNQLKEDLLNEARKLEGVETLDVPHIIQITYRGVVEKIEAKNVSDEVTLRVDCAVRNIGIKFKKEGSNQPVLKPMLCEFDLVPFQADVKTIDEDVLEHMNAVRACANECVPKDQWMDGVAVMQALQENESVFDMIDSSFRIEMAWFIKMSASGARDMLQDKVLASLPDGVLEKSPGDAANALAALKKSALYRFASVDTQSSVNIAANWVDAIANSRQPTCSGVEDDFLKKVIKRLELFLVFEGEEDFGPPKFGQEALVAKLQAAKTALAKDRSPDVLRIFSVFSWMLSGPQRQEVQAMVREAVQNGSSLVSKTMEFHAGGGNGSSSSSDGRPGSASDPVGAKNGQSKGVKRSSSSKDLDDTTLALFQKRRK